MIYEFALEPDLVARWHDRKEYLFFDEKFGLRSRRIVSAYPKNWKKLVWKIFEAGSATDNQNARMRMTELIQILWRNAVKRSSTFPEITVWLERAEAEHAERPFHAIIASDNPRNQPFVIHVKELIEYGHEKWQVPDIFPTPRNAVEIADAVLPLMRLCRQAILVDPYFDPVKKKFRDTFEAILATCRKNVCGIENIQVELHTSIDRFFQTWERGDNRNLNEESKAYDNFVLECQSRLPQIIPAAIQLKVVVWKQKAGGEKLHNRYL
ncbi:MAG: hypothetical protein P1P89_23245, partial [Desulfobacterales bacterium]|nr:hypothetical protein [Desulfobacterales bacterium]